MFVEVPIYKKLTIKNIKKSFFLAWNFLLKIYVQSIDFANLWYLTFHLSKSPCVKETLPLPGPSVTKHNDVEIYVYLSMIIIIL